MLLTKTGTRVPKSASGAPEQNSPATTGSFDGQTFSKCSSLLEDSHLKFKFRPNLVFSVHETGTLAVRSKLSKIIGLKRKKRDVSAKGEELLSRLHAATPSFIFQRARERIQASCSQPVIPQDGYRYIFFQLTVIQRDWHTQIVLHKTRKHITTMSLAFALQCAL
jgi:hypothetical protein